jgi:Uma2 family endonuclease
MAETPHHRDNLAWLIEMLRAWFVNELMVYVSGNMFIYYVRGDGRRHVAPDVFVVRGVPRTLTPERRRYLTWEEGKGPNLVIELTSPTTAEEDLGEKLVLYRDVLRVREYFLFDPDAEYLTPPLQGYRLRGGEYRRIRSVKGRLPSQELGLHLERHDWMLRLYDPATQSWLPNPGEVRAAQAQAEVARQRAEAERDLEKAAREQAEAEIERLRRQLDALRGNPPAQP